MIKKYKILFSVLVGFSLSACSHENPLLTQPEKDSAKFIKEASAYAEKKLNYDAGFHGVMYRECIMNHVEDDPKFCPELFNHMIHYARKSTSPFHNITKSDLEDKKAFYRFDGDYLHFLGQQ